MWWDGVVRDALSTVLNVPNIKFFMFDVFNIFGFGCDMQIKNYLLPVSIFVLEKI